ncbi:hypothetical protein PDY_07310 [Photobacterium damselae subsp. damselae]|nr:hypothetical protein PDY_07310 [Photobacterium damselae subsp. damselae]
MQQTLYYFGKTHVASVFDTGLEDTQMSLASLFVYFFASVVLGKFEFRGFSLTRNYQLSFKLLNN